MNFEFEEERRRVHKAGKTERRQKLFCDKRLFRGRKAAKMRCGIKGCRNEGVTLKGKIPVCGQHVN